MQATEKQIAFFENLAKKWEQQNGPAKWFSHRESKGYTAGMIESIRKSIRDGDINKAVISSAIDILKKEVR